MTLERFLIDLTIPSGGRALSAAFPAWVRASFPGWADFVAIDGKTSRRSHDRRAGTDPIHLVSAFATNPTVAAAIRAEGADDLLAVKANQPTLRAEVEAAFAEADPATLEGRVDTDKGHGRVEERRVAILREVDWLTTHRRFPGDAAALA